MTVHKSQGSTTAYLTGDMDRSIKNPKYQRKIDEVMFYTLLSRVTSSDVVKIVNFTEDVIKFNKQAKQEMERLKTEEVLFCKHLLSCKRPLSCNHPPFCNHQLSCNHPLFCNHPRTELNGTEIYLHNIRKWDKHISYFPSDKNYLNHSSIFCFMETHTSEHDFKGIKEYIQTCV